ncbi:nuclear transport factor 2 family protein [Pseudomonas tolaasii]|uniref:nuclear transport factor 2 family protein n=1 Tax=Pseudomonas tolaasii TaxID=29442 RepID=UPI00211B1CF2|nr:nuclear transport factor 2 family protein [Pseudomonas tolaasii]
MTSFNLQTAADKLTVVDTLYRFAAGIDLHDPVLLASAFTADAVSDFRPAAAKAGFEYPVLEGRETIVAALSGALSQLDTTHSVSNPRVTLDGDAPAWTHWWRRSTCPKVIRRYII